MITVSVPATTANLGPGFDVLGLALDLHNRVSVEEAGSWSVEVVGEGAGTLAEDEDNVVLVAMRSLAEATGRRLPPCRVTCENEIPVGKGLGSSAAAIVGGLVAADALLETGLTRERLLERAAAIEGHGDNVSAALYGGLTIYYESSLGPAALSLEPHESLAAVMVIPREPLATAEARAVLPSTLSYEDATFQTARVALLAVAISQGRPELLAEAASDRMHQQARRPLEVGYDAFERALAGAGALAVSLSGAGPSVFGWVRAAEAARVRDAVQEALGMEAHAPEVAAFGFDLAGAAIV